MLTVCHLARSLFRVPRIQSTISRNTTRCVLIPHGRVPCPRPIFAVGRRAMSLSAVNPVTISSDRKTITFRLKDGSSSTQQISPTPKVKLEKLEGALTSLLSAPASNPTTSALSFGTLQWELDPLGDAIHRHVALSSPEERERLEQAIMAAAEELNHHPHLARGNGGEREEYGGYITITCTTHSPRGLSARDTRLAMRINELLAGLEVTKPVEPTTAQGQESVQKQITTQRDRLVAINRQGISDALESCACGTAKS